MSNVGAQLKKAREEQNKTRADVARGTGILIHQLAALEHGRLDEFPNDEIAAGHVRDYAAYLGFRPDEPVAEFWAERGVDPPPALPDPVGTTESSEGSRRFPWRWIAVGAAIVLAVVWFAMRGDPQSTRPPAEPAEPSPIESTPGVAVQPETEPSPTPEAAPSSEPEPAVSAPSAPPVAEIAPTSATALRIDSHGVGSNVENRELSGSSDRFALGDRVFFWTRVQGASEGERITHVWIHEGREISSVELAVGGADWRTWTVKTMFGGSEGSWAVEARDSSGRVLARSEFVCEP